MTGREFNREVGRRVRAARHRAGLALQDVTGVPFNTLGYVERGERGTSVEKLCAIAEALGVPVVELIPDERRGPNRASVA